MMARVVAPLHPRRTREPLSHFTEGGKEALGTAPQVTEMGLKLRSRAPYQAALSQSPSRDLHRRPHSRPGPSDLGSEQPAQPPTAPLPLRLVPKALWPRLPLRALSLYTTSSTLLGWRPDTSCAGDALSPPHPPPHSSGSTWDSLRSLLHQKPCLPLAFIRSLNNLL